MHLVGRILPLSLLLALAAGTPAHAAVPADFVGIVTDDAFAGNDQYREKAIAAQSRAGIGLIRYTFDWSRIETRRGHYDFGFYDAAVGSAARNHMQLLAVLFNPPAFRSSRPRRHAARGIYPPRHFADLGAFGAAVARRYGPDGTFWQEHGGLPKIPITSYQIWNEPNLPFYWPPKPSPRGYVAMLKAAGPRIRAAYPGAEIVTAGMPDSRLSRPRLSTYLGRMYAAGARGTFDSLAINAYARTVPKMMSLLRRARSIERRHGDSRASLWVTEMGWSDVGPGGEYKAGVAGQARLIGQAVKAFAAARRSLKLRGFVYYAWRDGRPYAPRFRDLWGLHTGLLRSNGTKKPSFGTFQRAVAQIRR